MDDVRGSSPVMTTKDLLLEVYHDMKIVRPIVESYVKENFPVRVLNLERDRDTREAVAKSRNSTFSLTNRAVVFVILIAQFAMGVTIFMKG